MDLIDRQAAIDALTDYIHNVDRVIGTGKLTMCDCKDAAESVLGEDELPSADVQPVVRCKDCKYFYIGTYDDGKLFFECFGWVYGETSEDDFCSHGERKDD